MKICNILKNIKKKHCKCADENGSHSNSWVLALNFIKFGFLLIVLFICLFTFDSPVYVEAAEAVKPDELPMLPDDVSGNHYLIYHTDSGTDDSADDYYCLYILTDYDPDSEVIYIEHDIVYMGGVDQISVNSGYIRYKYVYSINDGWTYHNGGGGSFVLVDNWTMISSTVDIFDKSNNELFFAKNANIITSNKPYIDGFGDLMLGSIDIFDSSFLGIMPFACMVCAAVIMFVYRMGRGF